VLRTAWHRLALVLFVAAVGCGIASALTWHDTGIEGAYLNRSVGAPTYAGVFSYEDNATAQILLGVAIGLAVAAVLVAVLARLRSGAAPAP
jgi:hypothetical protein